MQQLVGWHRRAWGIKGSCGTGGQGRREELTMMHSKSDPPEWLHMLIRKGDQLGIKLSMKYWSGSEWAQVHSSQQ
jgi:hypothetical protein